MHSLAFLAGSLIESLVHCLKSSKGKLNCNYWFAADTHMLWLCEYKEVEAV